MQFTHKQILKYNIYSIKNNAFAVQLKRELNKSIKIKFVQLKKKNHVVKIEHDLIKKTSVQLRINLSDDIKIKYFKQNNTHRINCKSSKQKRQ